MADKVKEMDVDVIVGPAMGGIVYAYELARQTGKRAIFTERVDNVMCLKRFAIHPGEKCIIAEDVVTTGISSLETKRVIEEPAASALASPVWWTAPTRGSVSHPHSGQRPEAGPAQPIPRRSAPSARRASCRWCIWQPQDEAGSKADPVN